MAVGTQKWVMGLSIYFVLAFLVVTMFSIAGQSSEISTNKNFIVGGYINGTSPNKWAESEPTASIFSFGQYFEDVFSFFAWDIHVYDTTDEMEIFSYFWILRIFLVYLPLLALILSIWYSVPTVSG